MRKLPFRREVKRDVTGREDLRDLLIKELDEDRTPAEFRGDELGMKALGLIPRDFEPQGDAGRASTPRRSPPSTTRRPAPCTSSRSPRAKAVEPPTFLEKLLGKKGGFDKDENKTVIAHELTHALADQHYGLDALQARTKGDDDRQLALSALIEGEATLAMLGAQMKDWDGRGDHRTCRPTTSTGPSACSAP